MNSARVLRGVAALLLAACTHAAPAPSTPRIDPHVIARAITLCTTTETELRQRLGAPTRDGLLRRERVLSWIVEEDAVVRYLAVLLDSRGVVVDLYWNLPTEIPWTPVSQCRSS